MAQAKHRKHIGGAWDEIGKLQFDFMVAQGLETHNRFLDYGCGSGRGAVHFIDYLGPGKYTGIDQDEDMLQAAVAIECAHLTAKCPSFCTPDQALTLLGDRAKSYNFALAQSVFTHCNTQQIDVILEDIDLFLAPSGVFYATFFEGSPSQTSIKHEPGNRITHPNCDPYHQSIEFWEATADRHGFKVTHLGHWDHPRSQQMLAFERAE